VVACVQLTAPSLRAARPTVPSHWPLPPHAAQLSPSVYSSHLTAPDTLSQRSPHDGSLLWPRLAHSPLTHVDPCQRIPTRAASRRPHPRAHPESPRVDRRASECRRRASRRAADAQLVGCSGHRVIARGHGRRTVARVPEADHTAAGRAARTAHGTGAHRTTAVRATGMELGSVQSAHRHETNEQLWMRENQHAWVSNLIDPHVCPLSLSSR
jgi:hypothetical protein